MLMPMMKVRPYSDLALAAALHDMLKQLAACNDYNRAFGSFLRIRIELAPSVCVEAQSLQLR